MNWETPVYLLSLHTVLWILFHRSFISKCHRHLSLTTTCPTLYWCLQVFSVQDEHPPALLPDCAIHQAHLLSTRFSAPNGGSFDTPVPSLCQLQLHHQWWLALIQKNGKAWAFPSFPPVKEIFLLLEETTKVFADQVSGHQSPGVCPKAMEGISCSLRPDHKRQNTF